MCLCVCVCVCACVCVCHISGTFWPLLTPALSLSVLGPQKAAQALLNELQEHPDAWTRVDAILEFSQSANTKYFALKILETLIQTRWKVLPTEQREGIKVYIVGLVIKLSSDENSLDSNRTLINKINLVLVEVGMLGDGS